MNGPLLVEPGYKKFICGVLNNCSNLINKYINILYNLTLLIIFIIIIGTTLVYKYKGKPTTQELENKEREKYQYILSKLKTLEVNKMKESQDLITNIPLWNVSNSNNNNNIVY